MNLEKLKRLQTQVRIGGKGTARRKKKVMHQTATTDDKKLQSSLKKLSVSTIPGIEEVNIIKDDLTVIHFNNPKAQASLSANTFAVTGHGETKKIVEMLPEILPQLGQETVVQLRMFANSMTGAKKSGGSAASGADANAATNLLYSVVEEDDVPMLVSDFDEVAKLEAAKTTVATIANSVQPASESEKEKNTAQSNAEIKETAAELPTLSEEITATETVEDVVKNISGLQPLENSKLNTKLNEGHEQQQNQSNLKPDNNEKESKNKKTNLKQENTNKIEKENAAKDAKKSSETQKKTQNKTQQKQESTKQQVKPEVKAQQEYSEDKKSHEVSSNAKNSKTEEKITDTKSEEAVQETVSKSKKPIQTQQKPMKTEKVLEKQQKKEKQQKQQHEQNLELNQQQKQANVTENNENLQQSEKTIAGEQQTNKCTREQGSQQEKAQIKPDQQQQQQIGQKEIQKPKLGPQQQQKGDTQIKPKNKQVQQKQQNQNLQPKSDTEQRVAKTEVQQQRPKQQTSKQQEKTQTPKLKPTDEKLTDKNDEPKQAHLEQQSTNLQVKGLVETKIATVVQQNTISEDSKETPKTHTPLNITQESEKAEKKIEIQQNVRVNKDNETVIAPERQSESETSVANISIKNVALQSLEATTKVLGIVNEIAKELAVEDLKENIVAKKELCSKAEPEGEQQVKVTAPLDSVNISSEKIAESLPAPGRKSITESPDNNFEKEIILNVIAATVAEPINEGKLANITDGAAIERSENIADHASDAGKIQKEEVEIKDLNITAEQINKEPPLTKTSQPQNTSSTTQQKIIGEDVSVHTEILPLTPSEPLTKPPPSTGEVLQTQTPQILSNETIPLEKSSLADEVNEKIQIVETPNKQDTKDEKSVSIPLATEATKLQPNDDKVITPARVSILPENKVDKQATEKKSTPTTVSPKQKASSPKQIAGAKTLQESSKQQSKVPAGNETPKTSTPSEPRLKLATKPQPAQQQQSQAKEKTKTLPQPNKSAPTTPTTPTKTSPEKLVTTQQKSNTPNTKSSIATPSKKTTPPQKQQIDATAKSKQTQKSVGVKAARSGGGNAATTTDEGVKKAKTPPATSKPTTNIGGKQQEVIKQSITIATPAVADCTPVTENTAISNQTSPPT